MFQLERCEKLSRNGEVHALIAKGGGWPEGGICSVYNAKTAAHADDGDSYAVHASLYNDHEVEGFLGLMYNAKDADNYDFVIFR